MEYATMDWNEEVMKWLAVAICLAMVGMAVMPGVGGIKAGLALAVYGYMNGDLPSFMGGLATTGSGIAGLGGAVMAVSAMEELTTLALVGCALTGVGLGIVIG